LVLILAVIFPLGGVQSLQSTLISIVIAIILGLILPLFPQYDTFYKRIIYEKPRWSSRMDVEKPLTYIQFIAAILLAAGIGGLTGGLFKGQVFNFIGIVLAIFSIGIYTGIYMTLNALNKKK
jgi:hypothetical protein